MADSWTGARTVTDLGSPMADWLDGRGPACPGYLSSEPDEETDHMVPILAAACRAGYVTTCSQPGHAAAVGFDGRTYVQRAAVEGWIADKQLLDRIRAGARRAELIVIAHRPGSRGDSGTAVTTVDGEPVTWFGRTLGHRRQIAYAWPRVGGRAVRDLRAATFLTLVDPEWGRDSLLWPRVLAP